MSVDVHDEYCGSFGKFSDCKQCQERAMAPRDRAKKRLPSQHINTSIAIPKPKPPIQLEASK